MKRSNLFLIAVFMLLSFAFIAGVSALGVTPGRITLDYVAGQEKVVNFSVLNDEHKDMNVVFMIQGELNQSVTFFENNIEFMPSEQSKNFEYKIKMPESIADEPGLHEVDIAAMEVPKTNSKGTYVGATVAVISQVYIYVPCPGKCIDSELDVLDAEQNNTATFIVPVINRGKLDIGNASASIDIYTALNEKVATINTDSLPVASGQRVELTGKWFANVNSGDYIAKVTIFYDSESKSVQKQFSVGNPMLSIDSILVNNFGLGEIAKLQILVENNWNQDMQQVYANLLVYDDSNQVMADVKSADDIIPAMNKKELVAYWDTVGVHEGQYNGKLSVYYGKKTADQNLLLKISQNSLDITGVGYAINPKGGKGASVNIVLIIVIVLLVIANLAWFVFFKRFRKK